jgi:predicted ATPase
VLVAEPQGAAAARDRLYLVNASGLDPFRAVYDALSTMGFYSINPEKMRDLQAPDPGVLLARDGGNIAGVLAHLESGAVEAKRRIEESLGRFVPGIVGVAPKIMGPKKTLEFRQEVAGARRPWRFPAASMSDGTLRALGVLVSVFQTGDGGPPQVLLVGIEEPEAALHPAAVGVLLDALRQASRAKQIVVTSHSPDLLDEPELETSSILAVVARKGTTVIAPVDAAGRKMLRDHLYTPGELLRLDQLHPDEDWFRERTRQLELFAGEERM